MIASLYRPLMIGLLPIALIACMSSGPTVADEGAAVASTSAAPAPWPQAPNRRLRYAQHPPARAIPLTRST